MNNFFNMRFFVENMLLEEDPLPKKLQELLDFTTYDKNFRNRNRNAFQSITKDGRGKSSEYIFHYQGKKYSFSVFFGYPFTRTRLKNFERTKTMRKSIIKDFKTCLFYGPCCSKSNNWQFVS